LHVLHANAAAEEIHGWSQTEMLGKTPEELWTLLTEDGTVLPFEQWPTSLALATGQPVRKATVQLKSPHQPIRWLQVDVVPVTQSGDHPTEIVASLIDITARKEAEAELGHQAMHDPLTGLPNRALINDRLQRAVLAARRSGERMTLMFIDLDHFKEVNDSLGHDYGDGLLQAIGPRLQKTVRSSDTVGRLGGDEFAVILPRLDIDDAKLLAQKIIETVSAAVAIKQESIRVGASIGIACYPDHGADPQSLMRAADVAMYAAKRARGTHAVYAPERGSDHVGFSLASDLRYALEHDQLELHYQPEISCSSRASERVEALVRWHHSKRGLIKPDVFVPLAEQLGLIRPLTRYVLTKAAQQCHDWRSAGLNMNVAVNVSIHDLQDPEFPELVENLIKYWRLWPECLRLEVTETTIMSEAPEPVIQRLRALGVPLSIDDFGTGYSSLVRIKQLPIDEIKIDKSFVTGTAVDHDDSTIVQSIIHLAHGLGKRVVAEGVETQEAWQWLVEAGCDAVQGYLLGIPMPAEKLNEWVRSFNQSSFAFVDN
jgi:diguanylate cyclase (GGDEF)-like protein/PAS domain S-box-containing protein